jgi:hypothetical protein
MSVVLIVYEVFEEKMQVLVHLRLRILLKTHFQSLVYEQNSLADILNALYFVLVDIASQKYGASHSVVLTVHIDMVGLVAPDEAMDGIECEDEFIEWKIGVHGVAEMFDLPLLRNLKQLTLNLDLVSILADVPDLELRLANVRLQLCDIFTLWEGYVIDLRQYLDDFVLPENLVPQLGVVISDVAGDILHQLVVLDLIEHSSNGTKH